MMNAILERTTSDLMNATHVELFGMLLALESGECETDEQAEDVDVRVATLKAILASRGIKVELDGFVG